MKSSKGRVAGFLHSTWRGVDLCRRILLNLLFVALIVALVVIWFRSGGPEVPDKAALVLNPKGDIVEQLDGDAKDRAINELLGQAEPETLLRDLLDAIEAARNDDRIQVLYLDLDAMGGAGLTKLQRLGEAISEFRETGKRVIAAADEYSQAPYYVASRADEVFLHHMGGVILDGYGRFRMYYKDGLDRLGVEYHVFRVGEYKSAVEPYLRQNMSDEAREANLEWLGDLWRSYRADVAKARGLTPQQIEDSIRNLPQLVEAAEGDIARVALEVGLVDKLCARNEIRDHLIALVGEDEETHSFHQIGYRDYLETLDEDRTGAEAEGDLVGVIVARGGIRNGSQPPGSIGGDSTAAQIRKARRDDQIKALVLRVDSGGGSAFASEVIRREFELTREAGKPVVVSMGSVAASGGYWISTASDEIWASPTTITGSIGIFGMFPTFQKTLSNYLGVNVDGVGTTRLSGALRLDRPLDPGVASIIQEVINQGYREFLQRVSQARGLSLEEVDKIARGRVWSGEDAHRLGLVDHLGGLPEAIAAAARHAKLEEGAYQVRILEREPSFSDRLIADFLSSIAARLGSASSRGSGPLSRAASLLKQELKRLEEFDDPRGIYAHCLCEVQ